MIADAFARLGLERRPWLEPEIVRRAYQERARALHPDGVDGDEAAFVKLGEAFAVVRDVARRLRALAAGGGGVAGTTDADLFLEVGGVLPRAKGLAGRLAAAGGPLGRALLAREAREMQRELAGVAGKLAERRLGIECGVRELDRRWPDVADRELVEAAARWERITGWSGQVAGVRVPFEEI